MAASQEASEKRIGPRAVQHGGSLNVVLTPRARIRGASRNNGAVDGWRRRHRGARAPGTRTSVISVPIFAAARRRAARDRAKERPSAYPRASFLKYSDCERTP